MMNHPNPIHPSARAADMPPGRERLLADFPEALRQRQFVVYYQPKCDIRPDAPVLSSAEALVRWQHPQLGLISPAAFISPLEESGQIYELDRYVWREAAAQIRDWKRRLGTSVPVSVNVSRTDLCENRLPEVLTDILREYELSPSDLILEITETAYVRDVDRLIRTAEALRSLGFTIEMDDFGVGYSTLHMVSRLPIDALKLDMQFVRDAFDEGGNTRLIEIVLDISAHLSVPVIVEGVETVEQMQALRALGCQFAQGYCFSMPVPPEKFERFLTEGVAL